MRDLELDWEDLVDAIAESSLIPVVGDEMRLLEENGQTCTIEHWSLQNLPEKLDADTGSTAVTLNELATRILEDVPLNKRERRKRRIARRMVAVFEDRPPPIPETLLKLAEIRHFNLFLTTAVDTLLEQAIEQVRGVPCHTMANSLTAGTDDFDDIDPPDGPVVYHLFGSMPRGDYPGTDIAITEEDKLEYLQEIGDTANKPKNLFDHLGQNELMFLGCDLTDGVAKLMLRRLADCRLFPEKSFKYICSREQIDDSFRLFLEGLNSELLLPADPREFTDQMRARWEEFEGNSGSGNGNTRVEPRSRSKRQMNTDEGFVFVSYRRDDKTAVKRVVESLESKVDIWWDDDMDSGLWETQIDTKINKCTLFVPILSRSGQQGGGSMAKKEWNMALNRRQEFSDDESFIIPLIIDDLEHNAEKIPSGLWREQVYNCTDGEIDDKTLNQIIRAYRDQIKSMQAS